MSDELRDEIEVINSIYGPATLTPITDENSSSDPATTYILNLPGGASSLRLRFPDGYPGSLVPEVVGTERSSGGRRGAGARDGEVFGGVLRRVFREGEVCVFDAVEEFSRSRELENDEDVDDGRLGEEGEESDEEGELGDGDGEEVEGEGLRKSTRTTSLAEETDVSTMDPPPWILSEPITENKSTFIARVARITTPSQPSLYLTHLLQTDRRARSATHNILAWRVRGVGVGAAHGSDTSAQDYDDDGETAAGARLLKLMQGMGVWDAMVVVTRWYGGVKLGPRRFAVINGVARDGFVRAGMVVDAVKRKRK